MKRTLAYKYISAIFFLAVFFACNKDTNELPPVITEPITIYATDADLNANVILGTIVQSVYNDSIATSISFQNLYSSLLDSAVVFVELCPKGEKKYGMCSLTRTFAIDSLPPAGITVSENLLLPNGLSINDLDVRLEVIRYKPIGSPTIQRFSGIYYNGSARYEVNSGDSFNVLVNGTIDAEGNCNLKMKYGNEYRNISGSFVDSLNFYGELFNDETVLSALSLYSETDSANNVLGGVTQNGNKLTFKLKLNTVGADSLSAISFEIVKY